MGVTKVRDGTSYPKWPQEKKVKEVKDDQCPKIIDKKMFLCLYPPDNSGAGDSGKIELIFGYTATFSFQ